MKGQSITILETSIAVRQCSYFVVQEEHGGGIMRQFSVSDTNCY